MIMLHLMLSVFGLSLGLYSYMTQTSDNNHQKCLMSEVSTSHVKLQLCCFVHMLLQRHMQTVKGLDIKFVINLH